ncbi:ATP-grasp domain-containing protein [Telmatocola sphagniphila]|uniref:D-alanine--D-alanine ligase n=1 Tax=Telmatocola sphagniphila TaxID=1123043 RepID=A0A8E6EX44_9BACT|nr:ATP-grasp domain-containing protein [Telmatocola sphagniphila]QVL34690.1 ATP-grasp domain-containing protein [Telmatocola sphagniphila]
MKIGIAFDLKPKSPAPANAPDDMYEEFDNLDTIEALAKVFRQRGHEVVSLGGGREFIEAVLKSAPDLVFNLSEGHGISRSRESRVPAVCEMLNIPYCGSDPLTLGLALDKDLARRTVEDADVMIAPGIVLQFPEQKYDGDMSEFASMLTESQLTLPVIVKPTCEGSSKGIRNKCLIKNAEDFGPTVISLWHDYKQPVLVEEFIEGHEVTVGITGNGSSAEVFGALQIVPRKPTREFVYSLEVKRDWKNQVEYASPPKLPRETLNALDNAALAAYDILGCRDFARIDFRIRDGIPYFLEANPLPGLNPDTGDICLIAQLQGVPYEALIGKILDAAIARLGL